MSFKIEKIKLTNFRSYNNVEVEFDSHLTILYGPNAIGKTNLIEALQIVTEGISFRNPAWEEVVNKQHPSDVARIFAVATDESRLREITFESQNNKKTLEVNGKKVRSTSNFSEVIPCVLFTPDDIALISDNSSFRRNALDSLGSKLSKKYFQLSQIYKRIVLQRNKLLKDEYLNELFLEVLDGQLIEFGSALIAQRAKLLSHIEPALRDAYAHINATEVLSLRYCTNIFKKKDESYNSFEEILNLSPKEIEEKFNEVLMTRKSDERARKISLVGPHRDDVIFALDGNNARTFASQGQKRSLTLAWKMAEVKVIEAISGHKPILLLDDVMSELDSERRNSLTQLVGEVAQTIITTANIGYFTEELLHEARVINIEEVVRRDRK